MLFRSRWRRGDQSSLDEFRRVWTTPRELPEGCVPLAEAEIAAGKLTTRHVWDRVRILLEAGQVDVAVGFFPDVAAALAAEGDVALTRLDPLYQCEYVCVMRRGHPLAAHGALTLDSYCAADHLRVSFAGRPRGFVDEALARLGRTRRVLTFTSEIGRAHV